MDVLRELGPSTHTYIRFSVPLQLLLHNNINAEYKPVTIIEQGI